MFVNDQMRRAVLSGAVLASGLAALTGCGGQPRDAAAVSTSFSGRVVTGTSTDLGSIVFGWGDTHSDTEITTPQPDEVTARCSGRGDDLAVEITAPYGWTIRAVYGSPVLTVGNTDQQLPAAAIDTTTALIAAPEPVDWSEPDQLDIAAAVEGPDEWRREHSGRVYVSVHVDCR
ncbi:hypothetical protein ACWEQV_25730 [Rhodococcus aetherivorans]|uniref:hypothetical protein n=1 Tax=Rhodococcus aetherivorans TaxID=191292 RepID=UPI0026F17AC8|nr:hypothetical protein [Rhodococcus aetherivorans]WKX02003.1 hypothetical protein Q3O43_29445 [Rhodococcus aetherivorans]